MFGGIILITIFTSSNNQSFQQKPDMKYYPVTLKKTIMPENLKQKFMKAEMNREPQKDGFFPLDIFKKKPLNIGVNCNDPEHKPPMHIAIPQGMGYKHTCPTCGEVKVIIPPQVTM